MNFNKESNKHITYYYEIFQNQNVEKPNLDGLQFFFDNIKLKDVNIYFSVCSSKDYDDNFQLIGQSKNERLFFVKNLTIDQNLFDCMYGCIYIVNKKYTSKEFLANDKKKYLSNKIAELQLNDIYECRLEVKECLKNDLLALVKYYGDSENKIKNNFYKF